MPTAKLYLKNKEGGKKATYISLFNTVQYTFKINKLYLSSGGKKNRIIKGICSKTFHRQLTITKFLRHIKSFLRIKFSDPY